jgi:phosphohistidine swiveling domain-containing protein
MTAMPLQRRHSSIVCHLDHARALDPMVVGSKAANLARMAGRGLPVLPAMVITTELHDRFLAEGGSLPADVVAQLRGAWEEFSDHGRRRLVVRSSSVVEDVAASSMAGQFRSVLDVRGWGAFLDAVRSVLRSASQERPAGAEVGRPSAMAVLVQEQVLPTTSGVMFGVDPVTGARDSLVVEVVDGGPDKLVSGTVTAQRLVLTRGGRLRSIDSRPVSDLIRHPASVPRPAIDALACVRLSRLARRLETSTGSPQDVEWALVPGRGLLLLQTRPITATAVDPRRLTGPVMGPGPLAETFPDPLAPLEEDLWVAPLERAVRHAMTETHAVPVERLEHSPVVTTVQGRVAVDLELFGYVQSPQRGNHVRLDPRPAFHALRKAWRHGTLRAELPARVATQLADTDAFLGHTDLTGTDGELMDVVDEAIHRLEGVHVDEMLAGTLLPPGQTTAAGLALRIQATAPTSLDDQELVHQHPVLLALTPPSLTGGLVVPSLAARRTGDPEIDLPAREHLRLRARWLQELTVCAIHVLGRRWEHSDLIAHGDWLPLLRLDEVQAIAARTMPLPADLNDRLRSDLSAAFTPPLPSSFRFDEQGRPTAVERHGARRRGGTPAGGGRGIGPVSHGTVRRPPMADEVLVVRDLQPGLAPLLPGLAGLVSENGSTLSHLAILAREYGVPTVVGVKDALVRFPVGTRLLVDGTTGELTIEHHHRGDAP